jgi:competence protein ComEC
LRSAAAFVSPWPWLVAALRREADTRRLFPWIAVAYGIGILAAFAADGPVSLAWPLAAGGLAAGLAFALRGRPIALPAFVAIAALFFGFAAALVRTGLVAAPVLPRTTIGPLGGFVESVEERRDGGRLVIRVAALDRVAAAERPFRVRVTVRSLGDVKPGDYVTGTARLLPPPEAARPGGYDFARDAYFRRIGAVGSVSGKLTAVEPPPVPRDLSLRLAAALDRARNALTSRIADTIGGQAGAVAAALVTGKRGLIEEPTNDALRAAGIYHVVSISGLHMMLAAGAFFWIARALLALSPAAALGWPIKKLAALAGMGGATAYCIFSGSDVAAERSLLMILVMQGAILVDRPALSLRNLAISALIVLTREPEALLGPSFQMSYAAVAGLIALAEWHRGGARAEPGGRLTAAFRWAVTFAVGVVATTLVASVATGPFATFHFQQIQPYGIIGNAATLPLVSLVVMPCAVLGVLAYPFGLDRPVWTVMGYGVEAMLRLAEWVAGLGGAIVTVPAFGTGVLLLLAATLLLATLPSGTLRPLALAPALLGLAAAAAGTRPDIYVARDGSGAAIRGREGRLVVVGRVSAFTIGQWLRADGDGRRPDEASVRAGARCDPIGCTVPMPDGRVVSYLEDRRGFGEDCGRAALVVSRWSAPKGCGPALAIDRGFLAEHGATALRAMPSRFEVTTTRSQDDSRPWLARPAPRRPDPVPSAAGRDTPDPRAAEGEPTLPDSTGESYE